MAKAEKQQQEPRRALLDNAKLEEMMAILIRNGEAFEEVQETLQPWHVKWISDGMGLVWRLVKEYHAQHGELPSSGSLEADVCNAVGADSAMIGEEGVEEVKNFLEYAYDDNEHGKDISASPGHRKVAVSTAKAWINEVSARNLTTQLLKDGTVPDDLPTVLDKLKTELDIAGSMTDQQLGLPFPEGWDARERVSLFTTGCSTLDDFMGGGWRGKEVILFMGPYGSCKTTTTCNSVANLVVHAAHAYAKERAARMAKPKGERGPKPKRPVVVLIFTEGDKDTYRCRLMANMAQVPWKKLLRMKNIKSLSDSDKPGAVKASPDDPGTAYELEEFKTQKETGEKFESEQARVAKAAAMANLHLVMIDCTSSEEASNAIGKGGIPELSNIVRSHFRRHKDTRPMAFWIDHVSALADRVCEAAGAAADDKLHLILKRMPRQAADKLAKPWNVPVALMHQLSGKANERGTTAKFHHADAAGSKGIGEYVDFACVTGPTNSDSMCVWDLTKHRREPPIGRKVVKVEGDFQRVVDYSKTHHVPPGGREIMARKDAEHNDALVKHGKKKQDAGDVEFEGTMV